MDDQRLRELAREGGRAVAAMRPLHDFICAYPNCSKPFRGVKHGDGARYCCKSHRAAHFNQIKRAAAKSAKSEEAAREVVVATSL